jgi:membrane protein DedA with SNARE-associated domain
MIRFTHLVPLILFVVPSLVIGYGFVLPRNHVSPLSELSVGFAGTVLGASISYLVGIRLALRR